MVFPVSQFPCHVLIDKVHYFDLHRVEERTESGAPYVSLHSCPIQEDTQDYGDHERDEERDYRVRHAPGLSFTSDG